LNSLTREKGDTKEFRRLVLRSFGKGRRETKKEFRRLILGKFFLAKEKENKRYNTLLFSRFGKPENLRKTFAKEEEEEEDVQRDSKVVKEYVENLFVKVVSNFF